MANTKWDVFVRHSVLQSLRLLPARKSFSSEDDKIEKIADDAEETDSRHGVSVDNVANDVIVSFRITDAAVCMPVRSGFGHLRIEVNHTLARYVKLVQ